MKIAAGVFKAQCLELMDRVNVTHEEIIVTKRGKPVVKILPASEKAAQSLFGYMKNSVTEVSDIVSPIDVEWDALQ
ncbi:MAG: type II toxin-antitoxin system prevent-host-death family antitoxin [Spirochaetes bacterium]|nr:type II toxin-antitoxin system prevent-host-death family antitoxin [Spirochaetota bacterium]